MLLFDNVRLWTGRRYFNASVNSTSQPVPHLGEVRGYIEDAKLGGYKALPDAALTSDYQVRVDTGTDIVTGDSISAITLKDGKTPWPGDYLAGQTTLPGGDPTSTWEVVYHKETDPGPFAHRMLYLRRSTGRGVLTPNPL